MKRLIMLSGALIFSICAHGEVWYVSADASGERDGKSWPTAFASPADAFSAAAAADEVRIAEGTYVLETGLSLSSKDDISVSGSWNPFTGLRDETARKTVIEPAQSNYAPLLALDGCTGLSFSGICFRKAFHLSSGGVTYGGAVWAKTCQNLSFTMCDFLENHVYATGSYFMVGGEAGTSNWALGGAMALYDCPSVTISDCEFRGNAAEGRSVQSGDKFKGRAAGGAIAAFASAATISYCRFVGNRTVAWNCDVWCDAGTASDGSTPVYASLGGAVFNCEKFAKSETYGKISGSYLDWWETYNCDGAKNLEFDNCLFAGNAATRLGNRDASLNLMGLYAMRGGQPLGLLQTDFYERGGGQTPDHPGRKGSVLCGPKFYLTKCTVAANQGCAVYNNSRWIINLQAEQSVFNNAWRDVTYENGNAEQTGNYVRFDKCLLKTGGIFTANDDKFRTDCVFEDPAFDFMLRPVLASAAEWGYSPRAGWPTERQTLYVDPLGDDSAAGTETAPLKSLTRALALADDGTLIRLAAGTYAASTTGETFPLRIFAKYGITVQGAGEGVTFVDGEKTSGTRLMEIVSAAKVRFESLTVRNARFSRGILADYPDAPSTDMKAGAGVLVAMSQSVELSHVRFSNNVLLSENTDENGYETGLFGAGAHVNGSSVKAADCAFDANALATPYIWKNTTVNGGSGLVAIDCYSEWDRCSFVSNVVEGLGKASALAVVGCLVSSRAYDVHASAAFRNCLFAKNAYTASYEVPSDCNGDFSKNPPMAFANYGHPNIVPVFENCTFADNDYSSKTVTWQQNGEAILAKAGSFKNCIVWGSDTDIGMTKNDYSTLTLPLVNCLVQHNAGSQQTGCIVGGGRPFRGGMKAPYRLKMKSSAIDKGTDDVRYASEEDLDFAGLSRLQFSAIDIGCYEWQPPMGMMLLLK